jgi:hypothetical protein
MQIIFSSGSGLSPSQVITMLFRLLPAALEPALFWLFFTAVVRSMGTLGLAVCATVHMQAPSAAALLANPAPWLNQNAG